eukprot:NODE_335_length_931_cov_67.823383_g328_i0.p1 GENE.NODE_335_length_931_cov_67.823383_g328_i0~~NODE_335_length_931_cov_67.823383_g328_i0.p1  ORF type:complete len:269 (+),score=60.82 NODE_335_length_931_cov_67.823383_g328_i0:49-807(+)
MFVSLLHALVLRWLYTMLYRHVPISFWWRRWIWYSVTITYCIFVLTSTTPTNTPSITTYQKYGLTGNPFSLIWSLGLAIVAYSGALCVVIKDQRNITPTQVTRDPSLDRRLDWIFWPFYKEFVARVTTLYILYNSGFTHWPTLLLVVTAVEMTLPFYDEIRESLRQQPRYGPRTLTTTIGSLAKNAILSVLYSYMYLVTNSMPWTGVAHIWVILVSRHTPWKNLVIMLPTVALAVGYWWFVPTPQDTPFPSW